MGSAPLLALLLVTAGCHDIERFSTGDGEVYRGRVVDACFMRRGIPSGTELCMTFDASRTEGSPGLVWSSNHLLAAAPLQAIPELLHDPLSTLSFGEGRSRNLLYVLASQAAEGRADITAVVSLMHDGTTEMRLVRGAATADATSCPDDGDALFAVFTPLTKQTGSCSY